MEKAKVAYVPVIVPGTCGGCVFYSEPEYMCHNERGNEAHCSLGFMRGHDMRDQSYYHKRFEGCKLDSYIR